MGVRFVHTADVHLDAPLSHLSLSPSRLAQRRAEYRETVARIFRLAQEKAAHLILIAGDWFEHELVQKSTIAYLRELCAMVAPIRVFVAPGNHDPALPDSYYRTVDWPENVHVFGGEWETVYLPELDCAVHGYGFDRYAVTEPVVRAFANPVPEARHHILVVHASLAQSEHAGEHDPYLPVTVEELAATGVDYVALGHIHKGQKIPHPAEPSRVLAAYPGSPEGLGWKEQGVRTVLYGELTERGVKLETLPVSCRAYVVRDVDVSGCETPEAVLERVMRQIKGENPESLLRLRLVGLVDPALSVETGWLRERLADAFFAVDVVSDVRPAYDVQQYAQEPTVIGGFVREALRRIDEAPDEREKRLWTDALHAVLDLHAYGRLVERG